MAAAFDRAGFDGDRRPHDRHHRGTAVARRIPRLRRLRRVFVRRRARRAARAGPSRSCSTRARATTSRRSSRRGDTFALGVCNGCQMMSNLAELIPGTAHWPHFVRNRSEQFEAPLRAARGAALGVAVLPRHGGQPHPGGDSARRRLRGIPRCGAARRGAAACGVAFRRHSRAADGALSVQRERLAAGHHRAHDRRRPLHDPDAASRSACSAPCRCRGTPTAGARIRRGCACSATRARGWDERRGRGAVSRADSRYPGGLAAADRRARCSRCRHVATPPPRAAARQAFRSGRGRARRRARNCARGRGASCGFRQRPGKPGGERSRTGEARHAGTGVPDVRIAGAHACALCGSHRRRRERRGAVRGGVEAPGHAAAGPARSRPRSSPLGPDRRGRHRVAGRRRVAARVRRSVVQPLRIAGRTGTRRRSARRGRACARPPSRSRRRRAQSRRRVSAPGSIQRRGRRLRAGGRARPAIAGGPQQAVLHLAHPARFRSRREPAPVGDRDGAAVRSRSRQSRHAARRAAGPTRRGERCSAKR